MHGLLAALASLAVPLALASPILVARQGDPTQPPPVVDLGYAKYQGTLNSAYGQYNWQGIRYGTAERFQAPTTPSSSSSSSSPILANTYGPSCYYSTSGQTRYKSAPLPAAGLENGAFSEDCLFLNVLAPAGSDSSSALPVVVWIHGGGYAFGSGQYDFESFLNIIGKDVVIVSIQYRLGVLGFLAGKEMSKQGQLNAGLIDQQFALQWVQTHISKFGGSSDHVTIFGESAGAGSVVNQVLANDGDTVKALKLQKPLFHAAIAMSAFLPLQVDAKSKWAQANYDNLVAAMNCKGAASTYDCLASADAATLATAGLNLSQAEPFGFWLWVPVIDGKFLKKPASQLEAKQKVNGEVFWGNNNGLEGFIFADPSIQSDPTTDSATLAAQFDKLVAGLFPLITAKERQAVAQQYPISDAAAVGNSFDRISTVIADSTFVCPTYWATEAFGSSGYKSTLWYGYATHGADLAWYTGPVIPTLSSVHAFTGAIGGLVESFNPNQNPVVANANPSWPTYDSGNEMFFNLTQQYNIFSDAVSVVAPTTSIVRYGGTQQTKCDFWRGSIAKNAGL